jgi:hypothetical protein
MFVCMCTGSGAFAPSFESEHRVLRLSAKLFNVTPADLPPDVRSALTGWLGGAPAGLEGYIRPGCVFLNLHITLDSRCAVYEGTQCSTCAAPAANTECLQHPK